ncbi:MAG TPA: VOC family protein [Acidimicrobiales bacterium]|nr:VOC family protein [Acidimicrobiales bacterium]
MSTEEPPRWRGINHLALVTPDMDATVRFYHGVLGMRLVATLMAGPMRHYFFEIGPQNTVAFFEWQGAEIFAKQAGVPTPRTVQLDHLSFNLPDEEALLALRDRLTAAHCGITEVIDHGIMHSVYFTDPNGIALEASWWALDVTGRPADYADKQIFSDPDPVPAVTELADSGRLAWMPTTELTGDEIVDPS